MRTKLKKKSLTEEKKREIKTQKKTIKTRLLFAIHNIYGAEEMCFFRCVCFGD